MRIAIRRTTTTSTSRASMASVDREVEQSRAGQPAVISHDDKAAGNAVPTDGAK